MLRSLSSALTLLSITSSLSYSPLLLGRPSTSLSMGPPNPNKYGAGIGRLELDASALTAKCLYDMVLVERTQQDEETDSGLFKPKEEQPKLHIATVLSVGPGREEENGIVQPMPDIKAGDTVVVKNPWGIGPKDEETADGRKISYVRGQDVAGVVKRS